MMYWLDYGIILNNSHKYKQLIIKKEEVTLKEEEQVW
jgi:hypothetical protein